MRFLHSVLTVWGSLSASQSFGSSESIQEKDVGKLTVTELVKGFRSKCEDSEGTNCVEALKIISYFAKGSAPFLKDIDSANIIVNEFEKIAKAWAASHLSEEVFSELYEKTKQKVENQGAAIQTRIDRMSANLVHLTKLYGVHYSEGRVWDDVTEVSVEEDKWKAYKDYLRKEKLALPGLEALLIGISRAYAARLRLLLARFNRAKKELQISEFTARWKSKDSSAILKEDDDSPLKTELTKQFHNTQGDVTDISNSIQKAVKGGKTSLLAKEETLSPEALQGVSPEVYKQVLTEGFTTDSEQTKERLKKQDDTVWFLGNR